MFGLPSAAKIADEPFATVQASNVVSRIFTSLPFGWWFRANGTRYSTP